jgi:hypothetical protein
MFNEKLCKMKTIVYEVSLTGEGRNYYTLYRHAFGDGTLPINRFIKNLSIDYDQAIDEARKICGPDEKTESYHKTLICNNDETNPIVIGFDVLRFGKYKNYKVCEIFEKDKKYVEWIAKGGPIKDNNGNWNTIIEDKYPLIQEDAIAIMVGCGDWIERNGKFMSVEKAKKFDWLDSLTINNEIKDGQRVTLELHLISKSLYDGGYNGTGVWYFTLNDLSNHKYTIKTENCPHLDIPEKESIYLSNLVDKWITITGTAKVKGNNMQLQRVIIKSIPA